MRSRWFNPSLVRYRYLVMRGSFAATVVITPTAGQELRFQGWFVSREVA
jgi:hypothetical protein